MNESRTLTITSYCAEHERRQRPEAPRHDVRLDGWAWDPWSWLRERRAGDAGKNNSERGGDANARVQRL